MKKSYITIVVMSLGLMSSAFASNDFTPFTTVPQAEQYCPSINKLIFTSAHPSIPDSPGTVTGDHQFSFASIPEKNAAYPLNMAVNGVITDANFRMANNWYGYISNGVVTCLYTYTAFNTHNQYALILRSQ